MWGWNETGWRENVIEWGRLEVSKNARVATWIVLGVVREGVAQFLKMPGMWYGDRLDVDMAVALGWVGFM